MFFKPTKQELSTAISENLSNTPTDMRDSDLYVSGSNWDEKHLRALRVIVFEDMPALRLIPNHWVTLFYKNAYKNLKRDIEAPSLDDIRHWDTMEDNYVENTVVDMLQQQGPQSGNTPDSESSEENVPEFPSRLVIHNLVHVVSSIVRNHSAPYGMEVTTEDIPLKLYLGPDQGRPHLREVHNDGGLVLTAGGNREAIPLISFEAKRRDAGGVHRPTGQREAYNARTLAQEVAELLAVALAGNRQTATGGDQQAYVLTIHGTQMRLVTSYFSDEYLQHVQSDRMPVDQHLYVRRSRFYELKEY